MKYTITTTADVTVHNSQHPSQLQKNQQANFNTLLQTTELRGNIYYHSNPIKKTNKNHATWEWSFESDYEGVYHDGKNVIGLLLLDFDGVPFIDNLTNTTKFDIPVFKTSGINQNIWVKLDK